MTSLKRQKSSFVLFLSPRVDVFFHLNTEELSFLIWAGDPIRGVLYPFDAKSAYGGGRGLRAHSETTAAYMSVWWGVISGSRPPFGKLGRFPCVRGEVSEELSWGGMNQWMNVAKGACDMCMCKGGWCVFPLLLLPSFFPLLSKVKYFFEGNCWKGKGRHTHRDRTASNPPWKGWAGCLS